MTRVISLIEMSLCGMLTIPVELRLFAYAFEMETVAEVILLPAMRLASLIAFLMDFDASSIFVMAPFLIPWDLEIPCPCI